MKIRSLILSIATTLTTMAAVAQNGGFSYQAVVRDSKGELVSNKNVGLRITLTDQEGKQNFYQEVQSVPTNSYGVLSTTIGAADTTVLKNLKWNDGVWMRVEIDAAGGTKYTDMGLTPIQAVPYALYAANGGKGAKGDKGDKGDPGEPGTGLSNRGAWSAGSYKAGEYVFAPSAANPAVNTMWIAQRDIDASTSAPTVGEDWVEFQAPKGDKGDPGEQGVGISGTSFNNDDHTLTITLTNGQTFTTQSLQGPQGLQGEQGPAGPQGNPGTGLTNRGAWNAANTYKVGDYVFATSSTSAEVNSMWIAQNDNISSSVQPKDDAANWVEFQAQRGEQGPAGRDGMQVEGTEGQTLVHNGTTWVATDQLSVKKLDVTGNNASSGEALFEVKDKDGNVVFAVYPDGVCVYVDESKSADKVRSGLVVTSRPATKDGTPQDYLVVNTNGTQVIVDQDESKVRSGLIVTKRPATKGEEAQDYLVVNPNGTQVIVDQNDSKVRSGLIVTKRPATKGEEAQDYLVVNPNGTQVIVDQNDDKVRSGLIVTKRPATKGEEAQDYLVVNPNGTQVIVDQNDSKVRSGLIVTKRPATKGEEAQDYLVVNPNGTQVIVDQNDSKVRSGLIVTKRPATKGEEAQDYLVVNPNGTQVIVDQNADKFRSGLIVTKRPATKGEEAQDYLVVNPNGTQVIVDDELEGDTKAKRSGFVVTSRPATKDDSPVNYLKVATDGTKISFDENSSKAKRSGIIVTSHPATKDGVENDVMEVTPDSTRVYVTGGSAKSGFGVEGKAGTGSGKNGFAVTEKSSSGNAGYLNVTAENFFAGYDAGRITKPSSVQNPNNPYEYLPAGINNTYVGNNAGYNNNNGVNNVFMGYNAGYSTISNSAYQGMQYNSTTQQYEETYRSEGSFNVFIGSEAGQGNTSGMSNVFVGEKAGYNNSSCISNIFIGQDAGYSTTAGGKNLSWSLPGINSSLRVYNGSLNMFVGTRSGFRNTTGSKNTFIGHMAGYSNTTGENNVYIGYNAGSETTGSNNTFINSASGNYTGSNNIIIAGGTVSNDLLNGTEPNTNTVYSITDNAVAIGKLLLGKQGSTSSSGDGQLVVNGTLRSSHIYPMKTSEYPSYDIGSTTARWNTVYAKSLNISYLITCGSIQPISSSSYNLGTSDLRWKNAFITYLNTSKVDCSLTPNKKETYSIGSNSYKWKEVYATTFYGTVSGSSDIRLKKDVETLSGALEKVLKLRGISYYWKNAEELGSDSTHCQFDGRKHIGVIAQEIEAEFPELVNTDEDGFKSVEYANLTPVLIEAVKELKAEKDELQATVESQQAKIDNQQKEIDELKAANSKLQSQIEQILEKLK